MLRVSLPLRNIISTTQKDNFFLSQLSNGLKVLTSNDGTGTTGMGLFALNGAKFENSATSGSAAILESLPLQGNAVHTQEDISKALGMIGNAFKNVNNKEAMGTILMAPRYHSREGLRLLNGMCLQPTRDPIIFERAKEITRQRTALADRDATRVCFELIHQAAWAGKGLGNDLCPSNEALDRLTLENFLLFHATYSQPDRTVIAATGIADHQAFAKMCLEELKFPEKPTNAALHDRIWVDTTTPDYQYCGGSKILHNTKAPDSTKKFAEKNLSHIGLMFQGVPINHPDYYPVALIQSLLGGGTSFSSGGPGKGMQTKLFREVLHREGWLHGIECITAWYSDGGIVGLYGSAPHEWCRHLLHVMLYQAASICQRVDATHVEMAKNQLCSQLVLLGEGREQMVSDMGFNMVVHNYITTADEIMKGTQSVTLADLKRVCATMMGKPITFALYGDSKGVPEHALLERQLRALYQKLNVD